MRLLLHGSLLFWSVVAPLLGHDVTPARLELTFPGPTATFRVSNGPNETGCATAINIEIPPDNVVTVSPRTAAYVTPPETGFTFTVTPLKVGQTLLIAEWRITSPSPTCSGGGPLLIPVVVTAAAAPPNLAVQKTAPASVNAGAAFVYQIAVNNSGGGAASAVSVTDPLPAGVRLNGAVTATAGATCTGSSTITCSLASLPASQAFSVSIPVLAPEVAGTLNNTATARAGNMEGLRTGSASTVVNISNSAVLAVRKLAPATAPVGGAFNYQIQVTNSGTAAATNVTVTDALPAAVRLNGQVTGAACTGTTTITCTVANLGAGQSVTITIPVQATAAGNVSNTASASVPGGSPVTGTASTAVGGGEARIQVTKTAPEKALAASSFTYQIVVANTGTGAASGVTLDDPLPSGVRLAGSVTGPNCSVLPLFVPTVQCRVETLAAGQSFTVTIPVTLESGFTGSLQNRATASGSGTSGSVTGTAVTLVERGDIPGLGFSKTGPAVAAAGGAFNYILTLSNRTGQTLTNLKVLDPLPAGMLLRERPTGAVCTLDSPIECSIPFLGGLQSVVITIPVSAPLTTGMVSNTATVLQDSSGGGLSSTLVTEIIPAGAASLTIEKSAPATAAVGGQFAYEIRVTNRGTTDAVNVEVTDTLPAGVALRGNASASAGSCSAAGTAVTCRLGTIRPGQSVLVLIPVTVSSPQLEISNTAQVNAGNLVEPRRGSATTRITPARAALRVKLEARSGARTITRIGRTMRYGYLASVRNTGPDPAQEVRWELRLPDQFQSAQPVLIRGVAGQYFDVEDPVWCGREGQVVTCRYPRPLAAGDEIEIWIDGELSGPNRAVTANLEASAVNAASASTLTTISLENRTRLTIDTTVTVDAQNVFLYTIQARNLGPDDANNVQVTHVVEDQMTITATGPECSTSGSSALCRFGTIPAFESRTTTVRARGGALATDRTAITTATANEVLSSDPTASTTARSGGSPSADLRIQLTSSALLASRPVLVDVVNRGPADADGVVITLTPPHGIGLTEDPPAICDRSLQVTCRIGRLAVGQRWQQSFFFQVPGAPATLLGRVAATTPDPRGADNMQSVEIRTAREVAQGYPDPGSTSSSGAYQPGTVVPGSDPSIFGAGMSGRTTVPAAVPLPFQLDGVSVTLNGFPAPLIFVSPTQVNFQTPWELAGESSAEAVMRIGDTLWPVGRVQVRTAAPEIFTMNQTGRGQGAVLIANTASLAAPAGAFPGSRPARRGEFVSIFCIGLGPVEEPPASGAPAPTDRLVRTRYPAQASIGGITASVSFAGLAPGFVGLYQVNAQVPLLAATGREIPVVLDVLGIGSNAVTIAVD